MFDRTVLYRFVVGITVTGTTGVRSGLSSSLAALAHHHGTFQLTDEAIDAPVIALGEALDEAKIPRERFAALKPGQVFEV